MKRVALLFAALLLWPGATPARQVGAIDDVEFTVALERQVVRTGDPIRAVLTLRNSGGRKLKPIFQERDAQGRPLPYPYGLTVRVLGDGGRILTENDVSKDQWWSWYYTWPQVNLVRKASKNRVDLKPGKEIVRTIDIAKVLEGCAFAVDGVPPGEYVIDFTLNGLRSNQVTLRVAGAT
jgi:hypothetical protein